MHSVRGHRASCGGQAKSNDIYIHTNNIYTCTPYIYIGKTWVFLFVLHILPPRAESVLLDYRQIKRSCVLNPHIAEQSARARRGFIPYYDQYFCIYIHFFRRGRRGVSRRQRRRGAPPSFGHGRQEPNERSRRFWPAFGTSSDSSSHRRWFLWKWPLPAPVRQTTSEVCYHVV